MAIDQGGGRVGGVRGVELVQEMRESYLVYAMSVIVARALPDVRDGLKPVQRRILYAMQDQGMTPGASHQKCAAIVGEVLEELPPPRRHLGLRHLGPPGSALGDALPARRRTGQLRLARR